MFSPITDIIRSAADLLLPDSCCLCGKQLASGSRTMPPVPLCSGCLEESAGELLSERSHPVRTCSVCGYPLTSEHELCGRCRETSRSFVSSESLYLYGGACRELIKSYKFDNRVLLAYYFADCLNSVINSRYRAFTAVPVPCRKSAKRKRGWDQIERICGILSARYNTECRSLLRRDEGAPQKSLDYKGRLSNLEGRIHLAGSQELPGRVLLLDDVFTTGATLDKCAEVLSAAGCSEIRCLTIARDL